MGVLFIKTFLRGRDALGAEIILLVESNLRELNHYVSVKA